MILSGLLLCATLIAAPGIAKSPPCEPAEVVRLAALIESGSGDPLLILAHIRQRMTTDQLSCWAIKTQSKPLLLDLARLYDAGDGIAADPARAEALYASAAAPISGTVFLYVPGVGKAAGRVMPFRTGSDVPGLPEADYLRGLMHIEGRAAKPNYRRGLKLIERAAKAGHAPAAVKLRELTRVRT